MLIPTRCNHSVYQVRRGNYVRHVIGRFAYYKKNGPLPPILFFILFFFILLFLGRCMTWAAKSMETLLLRVKNYSKSGSVKSSLCGIGKFYFLFNKRFNRRCILNKCRNWISLQLYWKKSGSKLYSITLCWFRTQATQDSRSISSLKSWRF